MKSAALLFGLNYDGEDRLEGCIRDVENVERWLRSFGFSDVMLITDRDQRDDCTYTGMLRALTDMMRRTWQDRLELVWIHYSGHGASVAAGLLDREENDGRDEGWVPVNAAIAGVLRDDVIADVLKLACPSTRIVIVSDACHSGTICDLAYDWPDLRFEPPVRNPAGLAHGNVILLSGCADDQTAADTATGGALTSSLLALLQDPRIREDVFALVSSLRHRLRSLGHTQTPALSATVDLTSGPALFPDGPRFLSVSAPEEGGPSEFEVAQTLASGTVRGVCGCCTIM